MSIELITNMYIWFNFKDYFKTRIETLHEDGG